MGVAMGSGMSDLHGRQCRLRKAIRDTAGRTRFQESPVILREVFNLDRHMYLVRFADGSTAFLFPHEIDVA
jgi:hypothetical protein